MSQKLSACKIGELCKVKEIVPSELSSKLLEMGFYEGKELEVLYKAPFGDPIAVRVGDYTLSMRKKEASLIAVELSIPS